MKKYKHVTIRDVGSGLNWGRGKGGHAGRQQHSAIDSDCHAFVKKK
jgi:hypothetical protein